MEPLVARELLATSRGSLTVLPCADASDEGALSRRMNARGRHLAAIEALAREGKILYTAALLDDQRMNGSVFVCDFEDRAGLDAWLRADPYAEEKVWGDIEVRRCQVGPMFRRGGEKGNARHAP